MTADTYSTGLGALLQGTGNNNNWGVDLNGALQLLDTSITGVYSNAGLTGMLPLVAVVTPERGSMALTMLACLLPPERSPASTAVWRRRREGLSSQPASATS
jgi:hypothetical protein